MRGFILRLDSYLRRKIGMRGGGRNIAIQIEKCDLGVGITFDQIVTFVGRIKVDK